MKTDTTTPRRAPSSGRSRCTRIAAVALATCALLTGALTASAADPGQPAPATVADRSAARFEGRHIDLSKSWEGAAACWVDELGAATCYRSEAEMDKALVAAGTDLASTNPPSEAERQAAQPEVKPAGARAASCSSSLRLYRDANYGGNVLYLSQRGYWINLSSYGFDNIVSSYRIGGCNATFRSGRNGTGTTYWGSTSAWSVRSSMSGWDNVLSSLLIN